MKLGIAVGGGGQGDRGMEGLWALAQLGQVVGGWVQNPPPLIFRVTSQGLRLGAQPSGPFSACDDR